MVYLQACTTSPSSRVVEESIPEKISYNFDIRPILSDKCLACHGPDANKREAGLRLDMAESDYQAMKEHPTAHALVPGKPEVSEVFLRITSPDTSVMMPPPASNLKLSAREIALIEKWIKQAAQPPVDGQLFGRQKCQRVRKGGRSVVAQPSLRRKNGVALA